ncbi:MAG TPA: hypothetical protein VJ698_15820 [Noviherbaspirillum sp.]|uniref:hypothetical protein n=1 Tax=Noviherbaspirillum sp. TaxID=1926288 RepID=UPI002B4A8316|nr:hypothetical protein [Noviherbaspirillum sp.]HJV86934.1 hypothetical protein [Noviherbaspirillum sp.]
MNRSIALGAAIIGGMVAFRAFLKAPDRSPGSARGHRMLRVMERMMASLPENSPPKLVMSTLPRVRDQNEQIITMLHEQNALLRELLQRPH